jgi:hypothetical protein
LHWGEWEEGRGRGRGRGREDGKPQVEMKEV